MLRRGRAPRPLRMRPADRSSSPPSSPSVKSQARLCHVAGNGSRWRAGGAGAVAPPGGGGATLPEVGACVVSREQEADRVGSRCGGGGGPSLEPAMSAFVDTNPFADPVDVNPFQDPSVTQLTSANQGGLDEFNPFTESSRLTNVAQTTPATKPTGPSQPAVLQPSVEPTPQAVVSAAQAGLLQQQEELEKRAAELERKERELQSNSAGFDPRQNNWPPLPKFCPIKPCFYQDFSADIPADYQRICKMVYYLWMFHAVTLLLNLLACLAWFSVLPDTRGVDFGLSILWFILFTPSAFLCWYRPIYKAFRSDSSFSFFVFFFIFFCQVVIYIIQAVGTPGWGVSGWIASFTQIKNHLAVAIIMMVAAAFFTVCAVLSLFLLKRVHSLYRRTGASFQRAQEEFSHGFLANRTVQNAAAGAASTAAQNAFRGN